MRIVDCKPNVSVSVAEVLADVFAARKQVSGNSVSAAASKRTYVFAPAKSAPAAAKASEAA